jgi:hypothetical protein
MPCPTTSVNSSPRTLALAKLARREITRHEAEQLLRNRHAIIANLRGDPSRAQNENRRLVTGRSHGERHPRSRSRCRARRHRRPRSGVEPSDHADVAIQVIVHGDDAARLERVARARGHGANSSQTSYATQTGPRPDGCTQDRDSPDLAMDHSLNPGVPPRLLPPPRSSSAKSRLGDRRFSSKEKRAWVSHALPHPRDSGSGLVTFRVT